MNGVCGFQTFFTVRAFLNETRPLLCYRLEKTYRFLPVTRTSALSNRMAMVSSGENRTRVR